MITTKRILPVLLALCLALGLIAIAPVAASAAGEIGIQAGLPTFAVNTATPTIIGFGGKQWAVIGYNGTGVASTSGTLTLLLANGLSYGNSAFNPVWDQPDSHYYSVSALKTAMEIAYDWLPPMEQALVIPRDLAGGSGLYNTETYDGDKVAGSAVTGAKFWPLSSNEATAVNSEVRKFSAWWWLRSPGILRGNTALVHRGGFVNLGGRNVDDEGGGLRPALQLNLSSVLFTSDTAGGAVKFTMQDASLALGSVTATGHTGDTVSFDYSGATAGKTLSAVVLGSGGAVKYYGKLVASTAASGSASITLPGDFQAADTVQIFVEDCNGVNETDFSSAYKQLGISAAGVPTKGIFGTNARWYGAWWHYVLFFIGFGFIWMWF